MATKPKGAPVKRGPGRPRRADGLKPNSPEARRLAGRAVVTVSLHETAVALIDACAAAWQCSRPAVIMRALSVCLAADGGIVKLDLRTKAAREK